MPIADLEVRRSMPQLRPALSFCEIEDRVLFLDLEGDRYFSIEGELADCLRAAGAGIATPSQFDSLKSRRILIDDGGSPIEPCSHTTCTTSMLDELPISRSLWTAGRHALATVQTRRRLRRLGLAQMTERFARRKARLAAPFPATDELPGIAADFCRFDLLVTTHDQCLPRSLALGFHLADRGFAPTLVFGVRLGPFRAHCWIECNDRLVNDRYDRVRHYQSIRRL